MKKKIEVTQSCIDRGCKGDAGYCPIAIAIQEAFGGQLLDIVVYHTISFFHPDGVFKNYWSPQEVKDFIKQFDAGEPVEPFSFELSPEE